MLDTSRKRRRPRGSPYWLRKHLSQAVRTILSEKNLDLPWLVISHKQGKGNIFVVDLGEDKIDRLKEIFLDWSRKYDKPLESTTLELLNNHYATWYGYKFHERDEMIAGILLPVEPTIWNFDFDWKDHRLAGQLTITLTQQTN